MQSHAVCQRASQEQVQHVVAFLWTLRPVCAIVDPRIPQDIRWQTRRGEQPMPDTPPFGRYAEIPVDQMTPEQQAGYRFLVDGPRGRLPGPYRVWVHNPKLVHAVAPLGNHFTPGQSALTER